MALRRALILIPGVACGLSVLSPPAHPGSGDLLWKVAGRSSAAPALADSNVFFLSARHDVVALDRRSGAMRWRTPTGADTLSPEPGQNVVVAGANVVAPDGALYAFDRRTGARRWSYRPASGDEPGRFTITTDGETVYAGSARGYAYGVDAATGQARWSTFVAGPAATVAHPVLTGDLVILTIRRWTNPSTGGVVALDRRTGEIRWVRQFEPSARERGSGSYGRVGVWAERVIASADDGMLYALDRHDGSTVWTAPRPSDLRALNDQRPVAVVGDVVVVGSDRPVLEGYDARTGKRCWTLRSPNGSVRYEMGSDHDRIYLVSLGLQLSAIDPRTGRIIWTRGARPIGKFVPFPISDDTVVYVPGTDGLYAFRR